jgi:hypothetical protein
MSWWKARTYSDEDIRRIQRNLGPGFTREVVEGMAIYLHMHRVPWWRKAGRWLAKWLVRWGHKLRPRPVWWWRRWRTSRKLAALEKAGLFHPRKRGV